MKKKNSIGLYFVELILLVLAAAVLLPVALVFMNSVKNLQEVTKSLLTLPVKLYWDNFAYALKKMNYLVSLKNTLVVTIFSVAGIVFFGSMAAYAITRRKNIASKAIFGAIIFSMAIPFQALMVPLVIVAKKLGLINSVWGMIPIYLGFSMPLSVFLFQGFIKGIPTELEEAALIDGCTRISVFFRIVFPLLKPIITTVALLNTIGIFNDFTLPLIMISSKENRTITLALSTFFDAYLNKWNYIMAALVFAMIPMLILFIFLQKQIVKGMTDGAIKG